MEIEERNKVEAVLFAVGKEIKVEEVAGLVKMDEKKVMKILEGLKEEYGEKSNSLHIVQKGPYWKFTIQDKYLPLVSGIVTETELDKSTMETLAVIAWKYPILQADIIKIRNNKAYEHMKMLEEQGFINKLKHGRTYKVQLTQKFFDYFDLPSHKAKEAFKEVFPEEMQEKIEGEWKEIEEQEKEVGKLKRDKKKREDEQKKKDKAEKEKKEELKKELEEEREE